MWLNEQRIQILLTAYCTLAQADESKYQTGGSRKALKRIPLVTLNLYILGISVEMMESWSLMSLMAGEAAAGGGAYWARSWVGRGRPLGGVFFISTRQSCIAEPVLPTIKKYEKVLLVTQRNELYYPQEVFKRGKI